MIGPRPDTAEPQVTSDAVEPVLNARAQTSKKSVLGIWLRYQVAGIMQFDPSMQWYLFYHRGLASLHKYTPSPYRGSVVVIRGDGNRQDAHDWSAVATGQITFEDVAGSHEDILRAPYAGATGEGLERALVPQQSRPWRIRA
jgi:thioesterase domain-containing protein